MGRRWQVCPLCKGEGTVVNPALAVWTQEAIEENPEAFEAMLEGRYNQQCPRCNGRTTVENTNEEEQAWSDREDERRLRAMEDGDWEAYSEPY